jgi:hypothetical protein
MFIEVKKIDCAEKHLFGRGKRAKIGNAEILGDTAGCATYREWRAMGDSNTRPLVPETNALSN